MHNVAKWPPSAAKVEYYMKVTKELGSISFPLCTLEKFKVLEFLLEKRSVISLVYCMPFKFHIIDTWKNHKPSMELWFCSVYNVKAAPYLVPNHCTVINFLWVCCFPFCGCCLSLFFWRNNCKVIIAKGHLISKCFFFEVIDFIQKMNKNKLHTTKNEFIC